MLGTLVLVVCTYLYNEAKLVLIRVFIIVMVDNIGNLGNYSVLVTFALLDYKNL